VKASNYAQNIFPYQLYGDISHVQSEVLEMLDNVLFSSKIIIENSRIAFQVQSLVPSYKNMLNPTSRRFGTMEYNCVRLSVFVSIGVDLHPRRLRCWRVIYKYSDIFMNIRATGSTLLGTGYRYVWSVCQTRRYRSILCDPIKSSAVLKPKVNEHSLIWNIGIVIFSQLDLTFSRRWLGRLPSSGL
jgi:hypothetical protein